MTAYLIGAIVIAALAWLTFRFARSYVHLRGTRVVTCPETKEKAAVEIRMTAASAAAVFGQPRFSLNACTHWPERKGCGQACVSQIESAPTDCLVRSQLATWYAGKTCTLCHRPVGEIDWYDRRPALLSPDREPLMWQEVDPVHLDDVLCTHQPLCFDCYVAETFRKTHPDLVLDNPYASPPPGRG